VSLVYLEHFIQDARLDLSDDYRMVFKRMQIVEIDSDRKAHNVGYAPYPDYRQATVEERPAKEKKPNSLPVYIKD
jgi:hypothetical protein